MRQVSTKVICGTVFATFLCTACHADGLTKEDVRALLKDNNTSLYEAMNGNTEELKRAMKKNTESLDNTISEGTNKIIGAISESTNRLTEAIEKLGTHMPGPSPESPPPIVVHKMVRHVYVHKYVHCCRVIWEEFPCCPWWDVRFF